jgi:hypothetical protein
MGSSSRRADIEGKWSFYMQLAEQLGGITKALIKYGSVVVIFYYLNSAVRALAGQHTYADIGVKFLAQLSISESASYIAGAGGVLYGIRERKLRRDKTDYLAERNRELEKKLDPGRTSSRLTRRGTTRKEDREE